MELASPGPVPLRVGGGELASTLIKVFAQAAHLFFRLPLCLRSPALVRRKAPFPEESSDSSECVRHGNAPLTQ
jgi:hypothetical protein